MNTKLIRTAVIAALPFSMSAQAATVYNIDLFTANTNGEISDRAVGETTWISSVADPGISLGNYYTQTQALDGSIIGNFRDLLVDKISATGNLNSFTTMSVTDGILSFNNPSLNYGIGVIQWDGGGASIAGGNRAGNYNIDYTGLGGVDLIALGAVALEYTVIEADNGFPITFEAFTDATHFTRVTIETSKVDGTALYPELTESISLTAMQNGNLCGYQYTDNATAIGLGLDVRVREVACGGSYTFGFTAGDTVDFSNLGAMQAVINFGLSNAPSTGAFDLSIKSITAVPEPSIVALLGAGFLGLGFIGMRRRNSGLAA